MPAWTFGAVGDVFINRPDPVNAFRDCAPLLRQIDVLFGNCEGAFTNRPHYAPSAGWRVVADEENGRGLQDAGFHVMACANNHILDAGHEGLADTLRLLRQQNIATVGAGRDVAEAHAPAFAERAGLRIAFLAYASVYQARYEARKVPGLARCGSTRITTSPIGMPMAKSSPEHLRKFAPSRIPRISIS
jgi:poly-gamma-glutamate capsule biosynthesis protein CapA/YwtB (metallophosphatase superfamily)